MKTITVTELNNQIKSVLEATFEYVSVEGEVSNVTYHRSGHLYFSIKDESSTIRCVMFRGNLSRIKFRVESGMSIIVSAALSVYTPRGEYQLNCFNIEPSGQGALNKAYEQLKTKLEAKGFFDKANKKPLPKLPKKVAIITSATGAAIEDMLRVANKRWRLLKITLFDTVVQGEISGNNIAKNIQKADSLGFDVIIVGRGGGSIEDLWGFNEEVVANAIFRAKTPIISAVGHEIDYVISDFVADVRAATPSAAMEILLPDFVEVLNYLDIQEEKISNLFFNLLQTKEKELKHLLELLHSKSPTLKISHMLKEVDSLKSRMLQLFSYFVSSKESELLPLFKSLKANTNFFITSKKNELEILLQKILLQNPKEKLLPNTAQIVKDNKSITLLEINIDEMFYLIDSKTKIKAKRVS